MRKVEIVVTFLIFFGLYILIVPQMLLARYKLNTPNIAPTLQPINPTPTLSSADKIGVKSGPTSIPTITSTPTLTPTSIPVRKPKLTSTTTRTNPNISSKDSIILQEVNDYRKGKGLSPLSTSIAICSFANVRAHEISTNFNHDGFQKRVDSKTLPYPSYSVINENIVMTSDFHQVITLWVNSPGHMANLSSNITYGCIGDFGNYYVFEGWKP